MWVPGIVVAALIWLVATTVATVVHGEYPWWGPLVAQAMLRFARLTVPKLDRDLRYEEWAGELAALQERGTTGVIFACMLVLAGTRIRVGGLIVSNEAPQVAAKSEPPPPGRTIYVSSEIRSFAAVKVAIKNGFVVSARDSMGSVWTPPKGGRRGK